MLGEVKFMAENNKDEVIMTLDQYILNPMGKNNAVLNGAMRELMRKNYIHKFDNLMIREKGSMEYYLYKDNAKNQYWAHIKVPSETVPNFYYDVVFKFFNNADASSSNDLFDWRVQFYSNDPAFVYTYAHVFVEKKFFIPELSKFMSQQAVKQAPDEKNPQGNVGYVKTIYFAYLLMQNRKLNKINKFEAESEPLDAHKLMSSIMPADQKIAARQEEGKHISKRKKKELSQDMVRTLQRVGGKDLDLSRYNVRTTKKVGTIRRTNSVPTVKKTKTTKKK